MYSYLTFSLSLAIVGVVLILGTSGLKRKFLIWSALCAAPTGLADVWFAPSYWQPDHLFGSYFSIEGVLFSFGNGALLAFLVWPSMKTIVASAPLRDGALAHWRRYVSATLPGFLVFLLVWERFWGSLPVMQASFAGFVALAIWLGLRGQLNPFVAMVGAVIFSLAYWAQTMLWAYFDKDLALFWNAGSYVSDPLPVTGLPGDELLWAAFYGLLWPHIIALTMGGRVSAARKTV